MAEESKSNRTSVTISKSLHWRFKSACALKGFTQKSVLERLIDDWLRTGRFQGFLKKEGG